MEVSLCSTNCIGVCVCVRPLGLVGALRGRGGFGGTCCQRRTQQASVSSAEGSVFVEASAEQEGKGREGDGGRDVRVGEMLRLRDSAPLFATASRPLFEQPLVM